MLTSLEKVKRNGGKIIGMLLVIGVNLKMIGTLRVGYGAGSQESPAEISAAAAFFSVHRFRQFPAQYSVLQEPKLPQDVKNPSRASDTD